ncbi:hypothetical protein LTR10_014542 [Elasticomyces elasticus]|uniref:Mtf2-like C-terminal domain-containing protein n=1 Tax=Exophiala sideris TaxID=1016849 RepID=A0ABR0JSW6_9EURO|nr:hypothetical protein LTR10_014542 [Elasticomyces elasticus]KAK5040521.1 hypothetical protein LTS07_001019 [Exophiala sideris]KAK5043054.1 hypothetical protein LTR13_000825 [Exophiala sideris]KAK5068899.1 hypothetical protein LTR69_001020 [Exophiala sideris]KAK5186495.1 hypothetical protein LTR44_001551 [Eurotiomycetes sp. CCFEE 6388]
MSSRVESSFLYQTRTILRRPARIARLTRRRYLATQAHKDTTGNQEVYNGESFLRQKAQQVGGSAAPPKSLPQIFDTGIDSTITATERRAFESILRLDPKQSEPVGVNDRSPYTDALNTDVENILDIFTSSLRGYHTNRDHNQQSDTPKTSRPTSQASPNIETAQQISPTLSSLTEPSQVDRPIERRPPETATSASVSPSHQPTYLARDLYPKPPADHILAERSFTEIVKRIPLDRIDERTQQAMRKHLTEIATALQAAATSTILRGDLAMWSVCESQIFSLASSLQPTPSQELHEATTTTESSSEQLQSQSQSLSLTSLTILHHVYPSALLLALRLYIKHFPSSPLSHNLLPRIRSLGHTSYVLGASPQFYNSLISLVWQTRSSLREIDSLLSNMERGGVELNEETYRILRQIEDERATDLKHLSDASASVIRGSRGGAWWKRHEQMFWFPRILEWLGVVSKRLNMKEIEAGRS